MNRTSTRIKLMLIGLCLCFGFITQAQSSNFFTSDHDLSTTLVNNIFYDSNGFVWIATEDGLNKFDGSKFTIYRNEPDNPNSLADNFINVVYEDRNGRLFIGSHKGLQVYDYNSDSFSPLIKIVGDNNYRGSVFYIIERKNGELWSLGQDVCKIVKSNDKFELQPVQEASNLKNVGEGIEDADGNVWITQDHLGLYKITPDHKLKKYFGNLNDPNFSTFEVGADHKLYLGTLNDGLYRYDKTTDRFEHIAFYNPGKPLGIKDLYLDTNGVLHIATDGWGLKVFDYGKNTIEDSPISFWDDRKLKVHSVTEDEFGTLWIGMYQRGVVMVPKKENAFHAIVQRGLNRSIIGTSCVTSMLRDNSGCLWLGTDNDGMYRLNSDLSSSTHLSDNMPSVIMAINEDQSGNLWVGSYGQGVGIVDRNTGKYNQIKLIDSRGLEASNIYQIEADRNGNLWFASMGSGLFKYNAETGKGIPLANQSGVNPWISTIAFLSDKDVLFAGTYDGLYRIDMQQDSITHIVPSIIVGCIIEDNQRPCLWAATNIGLLQISHDGTLLKTISQADGVPSNTVFSIEEDDSGNLWVSSNSGLCFYNPEKETIVNYFVDDGLQSNEFYKQASCKDKQGNLFFGGINGLTYFSPEEVNSSGRKLDLRLTDFYIHQTPVKPGMKSGSRTITERPIFKTETFNLSHDDNTFSVEFNTKQYPISSQVQFLYSLDGSDWELMPANYANTPNGSRMLTFTDLKSGSHTLRIKALDRGVESSILKINVDVSPAWYLTWWAKLLYVIITLIGLLFLYQRFRSSEKRKHKELQRAHIEDIKEAKLQFFTNISHEIRTPLTLVMSPLQKLLSTENDPNKQKSYRTILRNCERILRLVNELMDLRKIDNNQMKLMFQQVNIVGFISDVIETFSQTLTVKKIELEFDHSNYHDEPVWVDKSNFDKIIMNLLSNAVKYTPNDGKITIKLATIDNKNAQAGEPKQLLEFKIIDTGIGIPVSSRAHIFDRFYQVKTNNLGGTGIGLHLTNSLVKLHHGTITVNDNPDGNGTMFTICIPIGNAHLSPSETITQLSEISSKQTAENSVQKMHVDYIEDTSESSQKHSSKNNKVIYIAEDDAEVRKYLCDSLKDMFNVKAFDNGAAAFEAICKAVPDLLITDVMMPEMDGITLTRKIRQNVTINHLPVIMLTARNREEDTIEGLENGADAYIVKPFNLDILIKRVEGLIESRLRLRNAFSGAQTQIDKIEEIQAESSDDKLMERVMKVINKHLSDSDITVEMIADEIGISRVHLHRKLKAITNQSTRDFIRNIRLQQAAKLLREKKLSVSEVSYLVGFKHPNNFSTVFKDMFGMTPSAYCDQYHQD